MNEQDEVTSSSDPVADRPARYAFKTYPLGLRPELAGRSLNELLYELEVEEDAYPPITTTDPDPSSSREA